MSVRPKSILLLSSGLDSTVNLYAALRECEVVRVLTFNYGQRAAVREIERSRAICDRLGLAHEVIALDWLRQITKTSLVNQDVEVPTASEVQIDDLDQSRITAERVWVPNRNGVFLNIAASFAESLGADFVVPGFNVEEAATFADNTTDFLSALDHSFSFSTRNGIKTKCYTGHLNKTEIVVLGKELGVPFDLIWPCYFAGETLCGECESCKRFARAMNASSR